MDLGLESGPEFSMWWNGHGASASVYKSTPPSECKSILRWASIEGNPMGLTISAFAARGGRH